MLDRVGGGRIREGLLQNGARCIGEDGSVCIQLDLRQVMLGVIDGIAAATIVLRAVRGSSVAHVGSNVSLVSAVVVLPMHCDGLVSCPQDRLLWV